MSNKEQELETIRAATEDIKFKINTLHLKLSALQKIKEEIEQSTVEQVRPTRHLHMIDSHPFKGDHHDNVNSSISS